MGGLLAHLIRGLFLFCFIFPSRPAPSPPSRSDILIYETSHSRGTAGVDMGLCYSLRPRLFGDLSGSISNAASDSDQPPDAAAAARAGAARPQEDAAGGCGESSSLRGGGGGGPARPGDPAREHRRGDAGTDGVLIQNGGGGGKGSGKERGRRLQLLQKTGNQKQKNWDKLLVEEKEAEKEAKKVSKNIDRALRELKREYKQTHRLLLLGTFPSVVARAGRCFIHGKAAQVRPTSSEGWEGQHDRPPTKGEGGRYCIPPPIFYLSVSRISHEPPHEI